MGVEKTGLLPSLWTKTERPIRDCQNLKGSVKLRAAPQVNLRTFWKNISLNSIELNIRGRQRESVGGH